MIDNSKYQNMSNMVDTYIPQFILDEYPNFKDFIKTYYEWCQQHNKFVPWNILRNFQNWGDVDNTIDEFIEYFKKEYIDLPELDSWDLYIKHYKEIYASKGSTKALEFFIKLLTGLDTKIEYPNRYLMKSSDGVYRSYKVLFCERDSSVNYLDYISTNAHGNMTESSGIVENIELFDNYVKIYLSHTNGIFSDEKLVLNNGTRIEAQIINTPNEIVVLNGGNNYQIGDIVYSVDYPDLQAKVSGIYSGKLDRITIINGGSGYEVGDILNFRCDRTEEYFALPVVRVEEVDSDGSITKVKILYSGYGLLSTPKLINRDPTKIYAWRCDDWLDLSHKTLYTHADNPIVGDELFDSNGTPIFVGEYVRPLGANYCYKLGETISAPNKYCVLSMIPSSLVSPENLKIDIIFKDLNGISTDGIFYCLIGTNELNSPYGIKSMRISVRFLDENTLIVKLSNGSTVTADIIDLTFNNVDIDSYIHLVFEHGKLTINGVSKTFTLELEEDENDDLCLFGRKYPDSATYSNFSVKSCKIYDGNNLVRDLIPCTKIGKNVENEYGMYDNITGEFKTNIVTDNPGQFLIEGHGGTSARATVDSITSSSTILSSNCALLRDPIQDSYLPEGSDLEATIYSDLAGSIKSIVIDNYICNVEDFDVEIDSEDGSGAVITPLISYEYQEKPHYYKNGSFLSDIFKLQDSYYYQEYSYVLNVAGSLLDKYRDIFKNILHPAGFVFFTNTVLENTIYLHKGYIDSTLDSVLDEDLLKHNIRNYVELLHYSDRIINDNILWRNKKTLLNSIKDRPLNTFKHNGGKFTNSSLEYETQHDMHTYTITPNPITSTVKLEAIGYNTVQGVGSKSITVGDGTKVYYTVTLHHYETVTGNDTVEQDTAKTITLEPKMCTLTLTPNPITAGVTLISGSQVVEGTGAQSITVQSGSEVDYSLKLAHYNDVSGSLIVDSSEPLSISMTEVLHNITIYPTPSTANVMIVCPGYPTVMGTGVQSISAPYNSTITYTVTNTGYAPASNVDYLVTGESSVSVELVKLKTFTITPTPSNAVVKIEADGYQTVQGTGTQSISVLSGTPVKYTVSATDYHTTTVNAYTVTDDESINVDLDTIKVNLTISVDSPDDCTVVVRADGQVIPEDE